jgi:hypothetical protein
VQAASPNRPAMMRIVQNVSEWRWCRQLHTTDLCYSSSPGDQISGSIACYIRIEPYEPDRLTYIEMMRILSTVSTASVVSAMSRVSTATGSPFIKCGVQ